MAAEPLDEVASTHDDPRLRAAEQLVAREAHEVGAVANAAGGGRLVPHVPEGPRSEVVDEHEPGAVSYTHLTLPTN